mmetsp:Transcript_18748/g.55745  ORF Transcript_18748/g.55745 Transcript_18748/m.55745 type:complete len:122 (+) Transcript_18748:256-621(+)
MNAPDRSESYLLGEDEKRIEYHEDTKLTNAGTFVLNKEGHTAGDLLRMQVLRNEDVRYAGYQCPHPLQHVVHLKVQTTGRGTTPVDAVGAAVAELQREVETFEQSFRHSVEQFSDARAAQG